MDSKIFGIGLHKTGGSSLCASLRDLGYKTTQASTRILTSDDEGFRLDREHFQASDVYADHPLQLLYPEADRYCPGSKFIFTQREKESWLGSAESHFSSTRKNLRDPLFGEHINQYLTRLYGSAIFDLDLFSEAYDRYHEKVERYFQGREGDLLHLDICGGEGWEKLCDFLGKPIPEKPFPHANEKGSILNTLLADIPIVQKARRITTNFLRK